MSKATRPATELMLATVPPPFFARIGANAWVTASAPRTLTSYSCAAGVEPGRVGERGAELGDDAGVVDDAA